MPSWSFAPLVTVVLVAAACGGGGGGAVSPAPAPPPRSFRLGCTPWPYDATIEAIDWVYERVARDGDLISHHIEEGVPWPEALADAPFPAAFSAAIVERALRRQPGQRLLLSLNALDIGRSGLAPYRGATPNEALPAPWGSYAFDAVEVRAAYANYVARMVAALDPDWLLLGIEANLLRTNDPAAWTSYLVLQQHTYAAIKALHPDLPVGIGVFGPALLPYATEHDPAVQLAALRDLEVNADFVGLSIYPFLSALLADSLPEDYCAQLFGLMQRPFGVSECGYPAQPWTLPSPVTQFAGSEAKQDGFARQVLAASAEFGADFVVWYTIRDYDALWSGLLAQDPLALIWRDTGLYGENGEERQALRSWRDWLGLPFAR